MRFQSVMARKPLFGEVLPRVDGVRGDLTSLLTGERRVGEVRLPPVDGVLGEVRPPVDGDLGGGGGGVFGDISLFLTVFSGLRRR